MPPQSALRNVIARSVLPGDARAFELVNVTVVDQLLTNSPRQTLHGLAIVDWVV
jgi:hypothetical protein